jgi:hypothetical protein
MASERRSCLCPSFRLRASPAIGRRPLHGSQSANQPFSPREHGSEASPGSSIPVRCSEMPLLAKRIRVGKTRAQIELVGNRGGICRFLYPLPPSPCVRS